MNAFPTCFGFVKVPANHRHVICKINKWLKHSLVHCYWCLYLHVTLFIIHVEMQKVMLWYRRRHWSMFLFRDSRKKKWTKKVTFNEDMWMLQSEQQIPLEEWFSLAKSLFWHETNFERFYLKGLNIGGVFRTQSKISDEILFRKKLTTFST